MSENKQFEELETLTADQVAEKLGVTRATVWRHVRRGMIPSFRVGPRLIRFNRRAIEEWQRQNDVAVVSK